MVGACTMKAIIQGEEGSNSSVAARQLLGPDVELVCCASFAEAFEKLDCGVAMVAVLPFENSTAGRVPAVEARLIAGPLFVTGETSVPIRFVAAARAAASDISRILAHPMAAAQCRRMLAETGWQVIDAHDTAGAARLVSEGDDLRLAALCPVAAATTYGLQVVRDHCGDDPNAMTRFFCTQLIETPRDADDDRALWVRDSRLHEGSDGSGRLVGSYRSNKAP